MSFKKAGKGAGAFGKPKKPQRIQGLLDKEYSEVKESLRKKNKQAKEAKSVVLEW